MRSEDGDGGDDEGERRPEGANASDEGDDGGRGIARAPEMREQKRGESSLVASCFSICVARTFDVESSHGHRKTVRPNSKIGF